MADRNKTPFSDRERAREAGRKGGHAKARKKLTLARVEEELPPLDGPENIVHRRLEIISMWSAAGLLSGTTTHALVRATEVALKALEDAVAIAE